MKELEDTHCEVRKLIETQASIWTGLNLSGGEELGHSVGYPTSQGSDVPLGGFLEDANYAWLSNGPHFAVINTRTGKNIALWTFREKVTCVAQFPTQPGEVSLLLVGLDNNAIKAKDSSGMLCIFDCSTSRVLRAIRMPAGVEQVCVMNGGADWEDFNEKRSHGILSDCSGIACVVWRNLHHIVLDLRRSLWEGDNSYLSANELTPADIEFSENKYSSVYRQHCDKGKHLAYNLLTPGIENYIRFNRAEFEMSPLYDEKLTTALLHSKKIGCLISGCLGRIIIWQNNGSVGWISPPAKHNMAISHLALLEPSDDPRPFYYLWVAYQEESFETAPILQMYALLVERKYCDNDTNLHFKLVDEPSVKFELQLEAVDRVTSLVPIEKINNYEQSDTNSKKGEESLLLIGMSGKTMLFDLNQWYKEQMPQNIRACQNPNIFFSRYQMKSEILVTGDDIVLNCTYVPGTLREFPNNGGNSLEELFYPNSLCFEWVELSANRLRNWMTRGLQWELLREMATGGPSILIQPSETFHRCLAAGLVPFNVDCSIDCDQNAQREMLLSLCLEQRWAPFLIKCAKEWGDGSVSYLFPMFLRWGAQRASSLKLVADQLCIPLFDQSGSTIGDSEIKLLRFCSQQLECLSNVVTRLPIESNDLSKQHRALHRVATHLGVLLWFYDVGLLPETHEINEETLPITFSLQIPYPYDRLAIIYKKKREQIRANINNSGDSKDELFIDELMTQECQSLRSQWEREGGDITTGGYYPPPSLQSLLRSYLLECNSQSGSDEMENKHQITIYLLMDLVKLLQGSYPDVDQLIKYPSAFKMSPSLIKLTQAFWLLDHEDYQGFLDTLTGQLVSDSDVKDWHHKLVIRTLMRNNEYKLALTYLRIRKPPLSAIGDQSTSISLSVECGLVQTAFHQRPPSHYRQLLSSFFEACKACGKLNEILQLALDPEEEDAFVKFLEEDKSEETRLLYYLQRCRYTEAGSTHQFGLSKSHLKNLQSAPLTMVNAYNATLPKVTRSLSINYSRKHSDADAEAKFPMPMSHKRSFINNQGIFETVLRKVRETYVRRDSCQIPFISAPCTSLKLNNTKPNSSCILFPTLATKTFGKRTVDELSDNETEQLSSMEQKRRKLSRGNDTLDTSGMKKLGASLAFDTPLIEWKRPTSNKNQHETETPHSILKIRQLIHSSTSPKTLNPSSLNQSGKLLSKQLERKPVRQIRFSIGQPSNDSSQEDMAVDVTNEMDKDNASAESEEVFYSPNNSGKSQSTDSNYSIASIRGPRPRPGLRKSGNLSSNESLVESRDLSDKKESRATSFKYLTNEQSTPAGPSSARKPFTQELLNVKEDSNSNSIRCSLSPITPYSVSNESRYSSRVLPSDSSFLSTPGRTSKMESVTEEHVKKSDTLKTYSDVKDYNYKFSTRKLVSVETNQTTTTRSSILTKTSFTEEISERAGDEEVIVEVDDFGLDHEPEVCFADDKQEEACLSSSEESDAEVSNERCSFKELDNELKESTLPVAEISRTEVDNGNLEIADNREHTYSSEDNAESETSDNEVEQREEIDEDTDDYEPELYALKDKRDDENEECLQSLTNSVATIEESLDRPDSELLSDNLPVSGSENKVEDKESPELSNQDVTDNSNITDDESSEDVVEEDQDKSQSEKKSQQIPESYNVGMEEAVTSTVQSKEMSESNFTEDESVGSSIEQFELITDDTDPQAESSQNSMQESDQQKFVKMDSPSKPTNKSYSTDEIHTNEVYEVTENPDNSKPECPLETEDVESDSKKSDFVNESEKQEASILNTSHENAYLVSETDSVISTTSAMDIPVSSGPESTRNSPQTRSTKQRKTSRNKSRQTSESPTQVRMTRARRASSSRKELLVPSDASFQMKATDTVAVESSESVVEPVDVGQITLPESSSQTETVRPRRASKTSSSVEKEAISFSTSIEDIQSSKPEVPLRRSSRRAASVQREMPTIPEIPPDNVNHSELPVIFETELINESVAINKKHQRTHKPSVTSEDSDVDLPTRATRSTSVSKELKPLQESENKIKTRKRGSSVPKEITETPRTKRATSLVKEPISRETSKSPVGMRKPKSSTRVQSSEELVINSPAKNTRSRRLITKSITEEDDEAMLSTRIRVRSSSNASDSEKVAVERKMRERRAVSLEPSKAEVKKRTRSALASSVITEETIEEESTEDSEKSTSKPYRRTTSRKRTQSTTSISEETRVERAKSGRKTSRSKSGESDIYLFSAPDVTSDAPSSQQEIEHVPPYVFSPPQTRSRQPLISQLRREIKNFVSPLTKEEKCSSDRKGVKTEKKHAVPGSELFQQRRVFVHRKRTKRPSAE